MKILLKWINEHVTISDLSVTEVMDKLVGIGFEVEEVRYLGEGMQSVVVGEILSVDKHPNADKLSVCKVSIGTEKLQIITAANNIYEDMLFPLALDGANLPCGMSIKNGEIRGVESQGMMCSYEELKINNDVLDGCEYDGILDLTKSIDSGKVGVSLDKVLGLDDYVLDVAITANRPDCNSIYGLARELAAALGKRIKPLNLSFRVLKGGAKVETEVFDEADCPLYLATRIKDVKIKKSGQKIRRRLFALGLKSINNIVDLTNYVLLETGQPLHAFDADKIGGDGRLVVRRAEASEEMMLGLDGHEYQTKEGQLVIANGDKKVLAIAGVIGGEDSAIGGTTKNVVLESARFNRGLVRRAARELGVSTDSSKRFEKGVDFDSVEVGRKRFLNLVDAQKIGTIVENKSVPKFKEEQIKLEMDKINALLGVQVPTSFVNKTLTNLGFLVNLEKKLINVPLFREDIKDFADIAEEIIRFYGYDNLIEESICALPMTKGGQTKQRERLDKIESLLNAFSAYGIKNFSFVGPDTLLSDKKNVIRLQNPLGEEYSVMRNELVSSVLKTVALNLSRQNNNFRIYEIDTVFKPNKGSMSDRVLPLEQKSLCLALVGAKEDFYSLKDFVGNLVGAHEIKRSEAAYLHPGMSADIVVGDKKIGSYGKVHPKILDENVYILELNLETLINKDEKIAVFKALPKHLGVDRDIALIFNEEVTIGDIEAQIYACDSSLIKSFLLVDIYRGEQIEKGKKSVAFRLQLQNEEKTLVDTEINELMNAIIVHLTNKFDAKLRK